MAYPLHDEQNYYSPRLIGRQVPPEAGPYARPAPQRENTPERIARRQIENVRPILSFPKYE